MQTTHLKRTCAKYYIRSTCTVTCCHCIHTKRAQKQSAEYEKPCSKKKTDNYHYRSSPRQKSPQTVPISNSPNSKPPIPHLNARYLKLCPNHWHLLEVWHSGEFCGARCVICTHCGREKVHFWSCFDRPLLQDISKIPSLCLFLLQLLELPLPLQLLTVPMLSSQPFSGEWGFKNPARGFTLARLELISIFTPQNHYKSLQFSLERPPKINKNFRFLAK